MKTERGVLVSLRKPGRNWPELLPSVLLKPLGHLSTLESTICERSESDYHNTLFQVLTLPRCGLYSEVCAHAGIDRHGNCVRPPNVVGSLTANDLSWIRCRPCEWGERWLRQSVSRGQPRKDDACSRTNSATVRGGRPVRSAMVLVIITIAGPAADCGLVTSHRCRRRYGLGRQRCAWYANSRTSIGAGPRRAPPALRDHVAPIDHAVGPSKQIPAG